MDRGGANQLVDSNEKARTARGTQKSMDIDSGIPPPQFSSGSGGMAAWDCLAPGGTLVAVIRQGWEHPANETELLLFRSWFETVHARQEDLPEHDLIASAPPMQSRLIWAVREPLTQ